MHTWRYVQTFDSGTQEWYCDGCGAMQHRISNGTAWTEVDVLPGDGTCDCELPEPFAAWALEHGIA